MIRERLGCNWKCPLCTWDAPEDLTNSSARLVYTEHLYEKHLSHPSKGQDVTIGLSIRAKLEIELDKCIKAAMEWPPLPDPGPWSTSQDTEKALRDEIEKLKVSAAGRGLAIALWLIEGGDIEGNENARFRSPDAVIRDAVERYRNPVPEDSHLGISPSEQAAAAPASPAPASKLGDAERARIKEALASNFDAAALAGMFKVSVEEIEACR